MGIDALIEAARFLDFQARMMEASSGTFVLRDKVDFPATPMNDGLQFTQFPKNGLHNNGHHDQTLTSSISTSPSLSSSPDPEPNRHQGSRKMPRVVRNKEQLQRHCEQVKCQRAYLKGCLEGLRSLIPTDNKTICDNNGFPCTKRRSSSTSCVLRRACKIIRELELQDKEQENEIEKLKLEAEALKERLAILNNESGL